MVVEDGVGVGEIVKEQKNYKKLGTKYNGSIFLNQGTHFMVKEM